MFERGAVVQDEQRNIGVVLWDQCPSCDYVSVWWISHVFDTDTHEAILATELTAAANPERYAFEVALALGDTISALELYHRATTATDRFYVYRKDMYEPGGLEYWTPFNTVEDAKREIEAGIKYTDMMIVRARNNELEEILRYDIQFNDSYTESFYVWKDITSTTSEAAKEEDGGV